MNMVYKIGIRRRTMLANHLHDQSTFGLIWLVLDADIAPLHRTFATSSFTRSALEDGL